MINDLPFHTGPSEAERNSFNAAFYELGLRWYWDTDTYNDLLKAYDAAFLVDAIQQAQLKAQRTASQTPAARHFDWAQTLAGEIGA